MKLQAVQAAGALILAGTLAGGLGHAADSAPRRPAPVPAPAHAPGGAFAPLREAADPPPPTDDRGCDVISYDLALRLDPANRFLAGEVTVGFAPLAAGLDTLRLDFVTALTVDAVTRRGAPASFVHAGEVLAVALAPPPPAAGIDSVVVRWHGTPPAHGPFNAGLMFRTHDAGTRDDRSDDVPVVANVSQPWSAHAWWPCKDLPSDKAVVSVAITVPDTLTAVGNGTLAAVQDAGSGWRTWRWQEGYPIAPYLVSVAVADYVGWSEPCAPVRGAPVTLDFMVFPPDSAKAAHDFAPTCAMLDLMTGLAGPWPFPGEKYAQAEIKWIGAMEHQTATSYSQFLLTGDGYYENFVIHELAHQWFGDSLTPASWRDIWLNEGFARYCEALWVERSAGREAYRDYMLRIGARRHADLFAEQGLLGDPDPVLPNLLVYDKGAWLLHSLRQLVGDDAFFAFVADYATRPELVHGVVTTADAVAAAERAGGRSLADFFAFWLDTAAVPELADSWTAVQRPDGTARVTLVLEQRQPQPVPMAVPVEIRTTRGPLRETARLEGRRGEFRFDAPAPVVAVALDPDSLVLMRRAAPAPPPLAATGPWPNPVPAAGARFTLTPAADGPVTVRVYDARGRLLDERDLGSVPAGEPFAWDWRPQGRDRALLPSGVVWLEFRAAAGGRSVRRAVIVH